MGSTLYDVVGVAESASAAEVRRACRSAALRHHPDRGGSQDVMRRINEARRRLCDPALREEYDRELAAARAVGSRSPATSRADLDGVAPPDPRIDPSWFTQMPGDYVPAAPRSSTRTGRLPWRWWFGGLAAAVASLAAIEMTVTPALPPLVAGGLVLACVVAAPYAAGSSRASRVALAASPAIALAAPAYAAFAVPCITLCVLAHTERDRFRARAEP